MSRFIGQLSLRVLDDNKVRPRPLLNREGRQMFMLDGPFAFESDVAGSIVQVPDGFITDLSSIPRLPVIYLALNGLSDEAGVIHDYLYSTGKLPRKTSDAVLREACELLGMASWKVAAIYAGVRSFGASHYGPSS